MKFNISREDLLPLLQQVTGVIEKRQTLPILSNALIKTSSDQIVLTGTDLEVQLVAKAPLEGGDSGETTVPARKFLDICRLLPDESSLSIELRGDKFRIVSGRSRFILNTLDPSGFPEFDSGDLNYGFTIASGKLKKALEKTVFCMAQQDVRYYLNGVMLELQNRDIVLVASDGHRLARFEAEVEQGLEERAQIIIPRKGVLELHRLLEDSDRPVEVQFSKTNIRLVDNAVVFSSKLIDGKYPDFRRVFPQSDLDILQVDKSVLKNALSRVSVLSNEKYRGISLKIDGGVLTLNSYNPDHDEAEEELEIENPTGIEFSMGFNAQYLLEAVSNVDAETVSLSFSDTNKSCFVDDAKNPQTKYIVMPMRL